MNVHIFLLDYSYRGQLIALVKVLFQERRTEAEML